MRCVSVRFRDTIIVGFAMFAVFFGAGNLIFPPQIGFDAGSAWPMALLGLSLTGMLLPVLAVIAVGRGGGSFEALTRPIAPWFGTALIAITMIAIAWLITIPRTAGVAFEVGMMSLVPGLDPELGLYVFVPIYFLLSLYFAIDQSNVIDKLGRVLTPCLLLILAVVVIWAVIDPLATPVDRPNVSPFHLGFVTGYQTGDVFTGLLFAILFINGLRDKGYSEANGLQSMIVAISLVTLCGLLFVYGGLEYLGATGTGIIAQNIKSSGLLSALVNSLAGRAGAVALGLAVILACLTTAVGATAVMAQYIAKWGQRRISYKTAVLITSTVAAFQAFGGVSYIIAVAGPIFMLLYPVGIAIVLLGLVSRRIANDGAWKGATIMALVVGSYDCAHILGEIFGFKLPQNLQAIYGAIPLSPMGFAWILPTILGALLGGLLWQLAGYQNAIVADRG